MLLTILLVIAAGMLVNHVHPEYRKRRSPRDERQSRMGRPSWRASWIYLSALSRLIGTSNPSAWAAFGLIGTSAWRSGTASYTVAS